MLTQVNRTGKYLESGNWYWSIKKRALVDKGGFVGLGMLAWQHSIIALSNPNPLSYNYVLSSLFEPMSFNCIGEDVSAILDRTS